LDEGIGIWRELLAEEPGNVSWWVALARCLQEKVVIRLQQDRDRWGEMVETAAEAEAIWESIASKELGDREQLALLRSYVQYARVLEAVGEADTVASQFEKAARKADKLLEGEILTERSRRAALEYKLMAERGLRRNGG
jgi:hypothetical protein